MTEEIKGQLMVLGAKYFTIPKNSWSAEELKDIYEMYNKIFNTSKIDQGCGSCRREVITGVHETYSRVKRQALGGSHF